MLFFLLLLYRWKCTKYDNKNGYVTGSKDEYGYYYFNMDECYDQAPPTPTPKPTPTPMTIYRIQHESKLYNYLIIVFTLIALLVVPFYTFMIYYFYVIFSVPKHMETDKPSKLKDLIKIDED